MANDTLATIKNTVFIVYGHTYSEEAKNIPHPYDTFKEWNNTYSDNTGIVIHQKIITGDQTKAKLWTTLEGTGIKYQDMLDCVKFLLRSFKGIRITYSLEGSSDQVTKVFVSESDKNVTEYSYQDWVETFKNK